MNDIIKITYDASSYCVTMTGWRGQTAEIGFGDKATDVADHAQNLYELAAALNCHVEMEKQ